MPSPSVVLLGSSLCSYSGPVRSVLARGRTCPLTGAGLSGHVGRRCPVVRRRGRVSGAASELIGEPCGGAGPDQHLQIDGVGAQCECALSSGELPDIPPGDSRCWGDGRLPASCRVGHPARLSRIDKWGSRPKLRGTGATNRDLSDSFDGVSAEVALNQLHACGVCGAGPIGLLLRP